MPESKFTADEDLQPLIFTHQVRTFETDFSGQMMPSALLNVLQYAAGKHADMLGWSVRSLRAKGQTWVLQRFYCDIKKLPQDDARIRITTYPSGAGRALAYRDYKVEDESGQRLVDATSSWVILDLQTRRVVPVPEHIARTGDAFGPRITEFPIPKLNSFEVVGRFPEARFRIRRHDLDLNRHVNNVRYMEWGMESVPGNVFTGQQLRELDIVFKAECFFGDSVEAFCQPAQEGYQHVLRRRSDEKTVCLMRSRWESRP